MFGAEMPCDRVFVVAPEHIRMTPASCQDVELHSVVEETVVLLSVILILTKQCGRDAMFLSRKFTRQAQGGPGLLRSVILCETLANEVR